MQTINMKMIYSLDKSSGGHLEHVRQKIHPLSQRQQIKVFLNSYHIE